jgi:hypothetical protein
MKFVTDPPRKVPAAGTLVDRTAALATGAVTPNGRDVERTRERALR